LKQSVLQQPSSPGVRNLRDGFIIPFLRRLFTSGLYEKAPSTLIQVCYWLNQRRFAALRVDQNPLLGHLVLFLSRLNFIFGAAMFSAVYLTRFNEVDIALWGFVLLSTVLFSIFCYSVELERLGRALIEGKDRS
jgi:hypothetical protein